jgi:predicted ATP-grasp superfamily ATP-dependent carboligase
MENVLLLDTNFSSAPFYNFLIKSNYNVFLIGNNPDDYLAKISLNYFNIDYSDIKAVKLFIQKNNINYIIPGCNDFSYKICSILNEENKFFGIENYEINEILNNKDNFRKFAISENIPVPRLYNKNNLKYPLIIKPVDSYSGNGISIIENENDIKFKKAKLFAKKHSHTNKYLIEEFVTGQLYSHSAFISNRKIINDFFVEEYCIASKFAVDTSWVINNLNNTLKKAIRNSITDIANKLNLKDGLVHTQLIINYDKFWIIEITRRCPGDLYSKLIEFSTGFKYSEEYLKPFLNKRLKQKKILFNNDIIRHTVTTNTEHYYGSIDFEIPVQITKFISLKMSGDFLNIAPKGRASLFFMNFKNKEEFKTTKKLLLKRNLYKLNTNI